VRGGQGQLAPRAATLAAVGDASNVTRNSNHKITIEISFTSASLHQEVAYM